MLPRRDDNGEVFAALRRHRTATRFSSIVYLCVWGVDVWCMLVCVCLEGRRDKRASGVKW